MLTTVIVKNNGKGDYIVLPIAASEIPAYGSQEERAFFRQITAEYADPQDGPDRFYARARAHIYRSTDNYWAVFGLSDRSRVHFVRFAYLDLEGHARPAPAHPAIVWDPHVAQQGVKGMTPADMPAF